MELGLVFANAMAPTPDAATALAQAAEAAGVESLWTVEHVVVPAGYESQYPYSRTGRMPGEHAPIPDPLVWLAFVAARTERILLATGILILPQRSPFITAKEVATLDVLSGGRVRLGVGIGWLREEFDVLGVPFEGRGRRTDEFVAVMRALWEQPEAAHDGELHSFRDVISEPKPPARRVPVIVGGHTESSARRAGRIGDGYFPGRGAPDELAHLIAVMRESAERAGRDPNGIELTAGGRPTAETVERYLAMGIDRLVVPPVSTEPEALGDTLRSVVELVRAAA